MKNKKHYFRVYDKKLDSAKKKKFQLYMHYLQMKRPVTRIEVQMNVQTCDATNISVTDILELQQTDFYKGFSGGAWKIFTKLAANPDSTCFDHILPLLKAGARLHLKKRVKRDLVLTDLVPYARVMLGYAKNLKQIGFDPVRFLSEELEKLEILEKSRLLNK